MSFCQNLVILLVLKRRGCHGCSASWVPPHSWNCTVEEEDVYIFEIFNANSPIPYFKVYCWDCCVMHNGKFEMLFKSMKQIHQNDIQFLQHSYSLSLGTH